jgi:uncharacterized protein
MDDNHLPVSDRTRLRRHPERGHTDRAALDSILDQGWVVHVGFAGPGGDAQPFVIPTSYVRLGRALYIHGAVASRMLRAGASGVDLCATVTLIDGLVLARSAFHHSMNYRSAVIVGRARLVEDAADKARVLAALVERLIPGRGRVARPPEPAELKQTTVLALPLDEASVKIRTGPPLDRDSDLSWPAWAGVIPLAMASGAPQPVDGAVGPPPTSTLAGPTATVERRDEGLRGDPQGRSRDQSPAGPEHASHEEWSISDDRARIDFERVTGWLAGAYWCPGISRAAVERAAVHSSLVVGAYAPGGEQVGYLRVVSDQTRFANIMDVFVAAAQRGRGLGRALVRFALSHPRHRDVSRWLLGTRDAHGVYAREGFRPLDEPDRFMQRVRPESWLAD